MPQPNYPLPARREPEPLRAPPLVINAVPEAELIPAPSYPLPVTTYRHVPSAPATLPGQLDAEPAAGDAQLPAFPQSPAWPPPSRPSLKTRALKFFAGIAGIVGGFALVTFIDPHMPWKRTAAPAEADSAPSFARWSGVWTPPLGKTPRLELDGPSFAGHLVLKQGGYLLSLPILDPCLGADDDAVFAVERRDAVLPARRGAMLVPLFQHYYFKLGRDGNHASLWRLPECRVLLLHP
jgi:hypothetical protein